MHAVVTRSTIHDFEQGRTVLREEGVPRISQVPGFVTGHWVRVDENTGTAMMVFESEQAARTVAEQLRTNPPAGEFVTIDRIEVGEVVERA
jgi:hypothetical protein